MIGPLDRTRFTRATQQSATDAEYCGRNEDIDIGKQSGLLQILRRSRRFSSPSWGAIISKLPPTTTLAREAVPSSRVWTMAFGVPLVNDFIVPQSPAEQWCVSLPSGYSSSIELIPSLRRMVSQVKFSAASGARGSEQIAKQE